jgi:hypothetical protein
LGVATWASNDRNPWLGILMGAFGEETGRTVPQPGMPGPFALDDPERLGRIFADAGLTVRVESHPAPMRVASFDEWWERTVALAGPVQGLLRKLPPETVESIRGRAEGRVADFTSADAIVLPGLGLVALGTR